MVLRCDHVVKFYVYPEMCGSYCCGNLTLQQESILMNLSFYTDSDAIEDYVHDKNNTTLDFWFLLSWNFRKLYKYIDSMCVLVVSLKFNVHWEIGFKFTSCEVSNICVNNEFAFIEHSTILPSCILQRRSTSSSLFTSTKMKFLVKTWLFGVIEGNTRQALR